MGMLLAGLANTIRNLSISKHTLQNGNESISGMVGQKLFLCKLLHTCALPSFSVPSLHGYSSCLKCFSNAASFPLIAAPYSSFYPYLPFSAFSQSGAGSVLSGPCHRHSKQTVPGRSDTFLRGHDRTASSLPARCSPGALPEIR